MTTSTFVSADRTRSDPRERVVAADGFKLAALSGVAFVVLELVGTFLPGAPPASNASTATIATYFRDHPGAIRAQLLVGVLGVAALWWWFGALWRILSQAEGEQPRLAIVAGVALTIGIALVIVGTAITAAAAVRVLDPVTTHLLYTLSLVVVSVAGFGVGMFLIATCAVLYRTGAAPRWTCYVGFLSAAAFLVSTLGTVSDANVFNVLAIVGFLVWSLWTLAISAVMWRSASVPV